MSSIVRLQLNDRHHRYHSSHHIPESATMKALIVLIFSCMIASDHAFAPRPSVAYCKQQCPPTFTGLAAPSTTLLRERLSRKRRDQLGIGDDEDEYDLGVALAQNTDDFISKVVAGSLIVTILALLVAGIVIPATTDYGDGVCNPLLTGGRC